MTTSSQRKSRGNRDGKILVLTGILLVVLLGMVALAVDIGLIYVTQTQLQSASDSGSLAGGTELLPGLGVSAFRTPAQVKTNAEAQAVSYVAKHPAGEAAAASIVASRDVTMGTAAMNPATGAWTFVWGAAAVPYNAVGVTTRRSSVGTTAGDRPLPLAFARILGHTQADVSTDSVAVILPSKGIHIVPGSSVKSGLTPFAFSQKSWQKYKRARAYLDDNGDNKIDRPIPSYSGVAPFDPPDNHPDAVVQGDGRTHLFYDVDQQGSKYNSTRLFDDKYGLTDPNGTTKANVVQIPDGIMEMNIYPITSTSGNFGTLDINGGNNSSSYLADQIRNGVSADDLTSYANNTFNPDSTDAGVLVNAIYVDGDPGISGGPIESAVSDIIGQPRSMVLYSTATKQGAQTTYQTVDIQGIRFMDVKLTSPKYVVVQPASVSDPTGIPDFDEEIGTETSFFTPLILAK